VRITRLTRTVVDIWYLLPDLAEWSIAHFHFFRKTRKRDTTIGFLSLSHFLPSPGSLIGRPFTVASHLRVQ
jgi:hypothetical protein